MKPVPSWVSPLSSPAVVPDRTRGSEPPFCTGSFVCIGDVFDSLDAVAEGLDARVTAKRCDVTDSNHVDAVFRAAYAGAVILTAS